MEWNDQIIDDALRQSATSLEQSYPNDLPPSGEIWNIIKVKRQRRKVVHIQRLWAVAATLLLLITAVFLWGISKKSEDVTSCYKARLQSPVNENDALEYIKYQCAGNNIVCLSPAFKELESELNSSSTELNAIIQQIKLFGNDEQLLRARIRIENHQARIVKAMLQIL